MQTVTHCLLLSGAHLSASLCCLNRLHSCAHRTHQTHRQYGTHMCIWMPNLHEQTLLLLGEARSRHVSKHALVGCILSQSRWLPAQSMRLTVTLPLFQDTMKLWGLMSRWLLPSLCTPCKICRCEHNQTVNRQQACMSWSSHHVFVTC